MFYPFAIETSGVFGPGAYTILCDYTSNEPNSNAYLFQQIFGVCCMV